AKAEAGKRSVEDGVVGAQRSLLFRQQRDLLAERGQVVGLRDLGVAPGEVAVHAEVAAKVPAAFQLHAAQPCLALLYLVQRMVRVDRQRVLLGDLVGGERQQAIATRGLVFQAGLVLVAGGGRE